jgi:hypothetical protein
MSDANVERKSKSNKRREYVECERERENERENEPRNWREATMRRDERRREEPTKSETTKIDTRMTRECVDEKRDQEIER